MITLEQADGMAVLRGRGEKEWIVAPWWPCSGRTIRRVAPDKLPRKFVDEAAAFADEQMEEGRPVPPHGSGCVIAR